MKKIIFGVLSLFLLYACSNITTEEVKIENIPANEIRNDSLEEVVLDIENEGIYQVNTGKNNYIIFNGIKSEYKNVEVKLEDELLQIIFNKVDSKEATKKIYEIKPYPSEKINMIKLIENDEETHFEGNYF